MVGIQPFWLCGGSVLQDRIHLHSDPTSWATALNLTLPTNPPSARFDWTNQAEPSRFFRAVEK